MVCRQWYYQDVPGDEECGHRVLGRCPDECNTSTIHHERGSALRVRSHPTFYCLRWSRETFSANVWFHRIWPIFWYTVRFFPWNNCRGFCGFRERGQPLWVLSALLWPNRVRAVITVADLRSSSDIQCIWTNPNAHIRTDKPTTGFWAN